MADSIRHPKIQTEKDTVLMVIYTLSLIKSNAVCVTKLRLNSTVTLM